MSINGWMNISWIGYIMPRLLAAYSRGDEGVDIDELKAGVERHKPV